MDTFPLIAGRNPRNFSFQMYERKVLLNFLIDNELSGWGRCGIMEVTTLGTDSALSPCYRHTTLTTLTTTARATERSSRDKEKRLLGLGVKRNQVYCRIKT